MCCLYLFVFVFLPALICVCVCLWVPVCVFMHVCVCMYVGERVGLIVAEVDFATFCCQILKQLAAVCDVQPPSQEKNGILMVSV